MEGSKSEAVFDSLNLNPQLFVNEILNSVDDLLDGAFDFFHQEASGLLKTDGTDRANDLSKGVGYIRNMIQTVLDERLTMWETYCLRHCFVVPQGFTLPKGDDLPGSLANLDDIRDPKLDAELDSLREKLSLAQNEAGILSRELQGLEMQSMLGNSCARSVNGALLLYEQHSMDDMFQEFVRTASTFRSKLVKLKAKRVEEYKHIRKENMQILNQELLPISHGNGLSNATLEELQEFIADIKAL